MEQYGLETLIDVARFAKRTLQFFRGKSGTTHASAWCGGRGVCRAGFETV